MARLYQPRKLSGPSVPTHYASGMPRPPQNQGGQATRSFGQMWTTKSSSGAVVTPLSALQCTAVLACCRILSETIGQIPLVLYRRTADGHGEPAIDHPVYQLLAKRPNFYQTPMQFKSTLELWCDLRGNAYAYIDRDEEGAPLQLIPVMPDRVRVMIDDEYSPWYQISFERSEAIFNIPARDMWHLKWLSYDTYIGLSPIQLQAESIGLALTTREHGARLFSNGAQFGSVLKHPATLGEEGRKLLRRDLVENYAGVKNAFKVMILEEGMDIAKVQMTQEEAEFLQTRQFEDVNIAAIYGVPPHMINQSGRGSTWGSGLEQMTLGFLKYSMGPRFENWIQTTERSLLSGDELDSGEYYLDFDTNKFLRGDSEARYRVYTSARSIGVLSVNEIRRLENLPRVEDPMADTHTMPLNSNATAAGAAMGGDPTMNQGTDPQMVQEAQALLDQVGAGQQRGE